MAARPERVAVLGRLLASNGVSLCDADECLQRLNDWFRATVQGNSETGRLEPIWYGVVNDIGLLLGDVMIERAPNLRWELCTRPKSNVSFQRHVVAGFSRVPNRDYHVDTDMLVAQHGSMSVRG